MARCCSLSAKSIAVPPYDLAASRALEPEESTPPAAARLVFGLAGSIAAAAPDEAIAPENSPGDPMSEAYIIDTCRTPRGIGKVGKGALADLHPQHLAATVLKAIAERNNINTAEVDDVIWGCSSQRGKQGGDMGRMAALDAGFDVKASGMTLDRFCGSGITVVNLAAASIMAGLEDLIIAGGCEMMSYTNSTADPNSVGLLDSGNLHLRARHPQTQQGICADAIATLEGISRQALDELALVSQQRAAVAIAEGRFDKSLVPVYREDGSLALDHEEFPRPQTTMEGLSALKPSFAAMAHMAIDEQGTTLGGLINKVYPDLKIEHVHHAGNSSGVVDGAGAVLLASPKYAEKHGLKPRARIVAMANIGDSPTLMLNAPVPAAKKVLQKAGMTLDDIDLFEINEAFSVVAEKFIRDLKLDRDKVNVNGGAMALGHPIGATGSMLIGTIIDELERRGHHVRRRRHGPGDHRRARLRKTSARPASRRLRAPRLDVTPAAPTSAAAAPSRGGCSGRRSGRTPRPPRAPRRCPDRRMRHRRANWARPRRRCARAASSRLSGRARPPARARAARRIRQPDKLR
jgi:acetyl-CoA C-acetyltransferase